MTKSDSWRFLSIALLLGASIFPLWVATHRFHSLNDDTYITLTYAKSLAAGRGFVFNYPPATLGTTSPLLTLLVAALSIVLPWMETDQIAVLFTALCWTAMVWVIFLFRRRLGLENWQAAVMGLVLVASGWVNFLGMEAYLFAFLLILSLALFNSRQWLLAGGSVGLLFLARGEGILMLPLLVAGYLIWTRPKQMTLQTTRPALLIAAGFLIPAAIWSAYAQTTFGSILPLTLKVKMAQGQSGLWLSFPTRLLRWIPQWEEQFAPAELPILNFWWLLVLIGTVVVFTRRKKWLLLLAWMGVYITGYTLLQVAGYWWYQLPILFVLQILAAMGLIRVVEAARGIGGHTPWKGRVTAAILVLFTVGLLLAPRIDQVQSQNGDSRAPSYLALCHWLAVHTEPAQSVAFVESGYLGYYTDNQIIDLAGLTAPDITPHIAKRDFAWGFWLHEPDYFIYLPDFDWALRGIRADPKFEQIYRPVATLPGPRETDFVIYAHR